MKKIVVHSHDKYVMTVTDEEYEELKNGDVDVTELMNEKEDSDDLVWKNGGTEWE